MVLGPCRTTDSDAPTMSNERLATNFSDSDAVSLKLRVVRKGGMKKLLQLVAAQLYVEAAEKLLAAWIRIQRG